MYQECQRNTAHRAMYYAPCLAIEADGKAPSHVWVDVLAEAIPQVYPFVFFELTDLLTVRGVTGAVLGYFAQRCFREVMDLMFKKKIK
jgi:hypothetical protein